MMMMMPIIAVVFILSLTLTIPIVIVVMNMRLERGGSTSLGSTLKPNSAHVPLVEKLIVDDILYSNIARRKRTSLSKSSEVLVTGANKSAENPTSGTIKTSIKALPPAPISSAFAFYNVYAEGSCYDAIVKEQLFVLRSSGLYNALSSLFYVVIGRNSSSYSISSDKKFVKLGWSPNGTEVETLLHLYRFCKQQNVSHNVKVLYFHNKGSYHPARNNTEFRRALDCFNLNPHCIDALDRFDTCGWRISPIPHIHYSGNMWWATCHHVRSLPSPDSFEKNLTFQANSMRIVYPDLKKQEQAGSLAAEIPKMGFGRFFAETWVGSKPSFRPSDCMNASVDGGYLSGYNIPIAAIFPLCPNIRYSILLPLPHSSSNGSSSSRVWDDRWSAYPSTSSSSSYSYDSNSPKEKEHAQLLARLRQQYSNFSSYERGYGSQCANASTLVSPRTFRDKVVGFLTKSKGVQLQKLQQRSRAWYGGQDSALLAAWWELYRKKTPPKKVKKKAGTKL